MINKFKLPLAITVIISLLPTLPTLASTKLDYSKMINSDKSTCTPPLKAYINDEVILSGTATFEEFIEVFPSNYEHYIRMFHYAKLKKIDDSFDLCEGRYAVSRDKMGKIMDHWTSLYTKENAVQWYQITLSNLAGPFQIDNYPLLAQAMWKTLDEDNLILQLTALKSLPLSTQKILVNAYEQSFSHIEGSHGPRAIFKIKGVDTDEKCDNEYCSYLQTLVDDKFKTIGHN